MECNKEEAVRARSLAEEKMKACDYVGAQKFVTKAQRLFPDLESIPRMIAICEVHLSANKKIQGLDDWYGVIQVQPDSDDETIRKQYRKLALLLHPDKNKFSGSEAAFKLVGEAYRVLSDPNKRSQYDVRYRSHLKIATRHLNANSSQPGAAADNAAENIGNAHTFWTCCKSCGHRYKYLKCYINSVMHCSTCKKSYVACNLGNEGVPRSSSAAGKNGFQGVNNISRQTASIRSETASSKTMMDKNGAIRGKLNKESQKKGLSNKKPKKDEGCIENKAEGENPQKCERGTNISDEIPKGDVMKQQAEVREPETSTAKSRSGLKKNQAAKKRTKAVKESSKSSEVDSSAVAGAEGDTNEFKKRSSTRTKLQDSCTKVESDGDFVSPPTKKTKSGCEIDSGPNTKSEDNKTPEEADSGVSPASSHASKENSNNSGNEDILSAKNKDSEDHDGKEEDAAFPSKVDNVENGFEADPEFSVFEDERKLENFAVNQVWSISDSRDGMPRKYVRVKKAWKNVFKLLITYLEPLQYKNDENIPVACGKFKNGETVEVTDSSIFSAQMRRFSHNRVDIIYPKKGEIWALFRDWDEKWTISLENHKLPYEYDFVEVVSDFNDEVGIGVAYMGKLEGSVSRFHRKAQRGVCQIQFTPTEILRFSHKVPAVKMTGNDKGCASDNLYVLDPDALPKDIRQVDAVDRAMDSEILKDKADGPHAEAPKVEEKAMPVPKTAPSPRKRRRSDDGDNGICSDLGDAKGGHSRKHNVSPCQVDEMNSLNESRKSSEAADVSKLRKSPRHQINPSQQRDEKKTDKQGNKMDTPKLSVADSLETRKSPNGIHQPAESQEGESSKKQRCNGELPSLSKQPTQLDGSAFESPQTTTVSSSCKTPRKNAFDFKNLKSEDKFRVSQVWAIYSSNNGLPSEYVQIKKIEKKPKFVIRATQMELFPPSAEPETRRVSCGDFKLKTGGPNVLPEARFSHQVKPVHSKKGIVRVYPRKGEIWALYRNCDITNEEHDIVEVVEEYGDGQVAKAVPLTPNGSNSLYIIQRKHGSNAGFIHIPKAEMCRFSHRIPAVRHEKKTTRLVEGGYWELDPTAIPSRTTESDHRSKIFQES